MRRTLKNVIAAAALLGAGHSAASAQGAELLFDMIDACRADYHRLCPGVPPGEGRIAFCLGAQRDELSPPCFKAFAVAKAIRACKADFHRLCPNVEPGGGRAVECLAFYADKVGHDCGEALADVTDLRRYPTYGEKREPEEYGGYERRYERHDRRYDDEEDYEQGDGGYRDRDRDQPEEDDQPAIK